MIIISSRKFRDSQNEYFQKALKEEVILTTLKFGSFRLVPVIEGESREESMSKMAIQEPGMDVERASTPKKEVKEPVKKPRVISEFSSMESGVNDFKNIPDHVDEAVVADVAISTFETSSIRKISDSEDEKMVPKPLATNQNMVPNSVSTEKQSIFVDPSLYDTNPREYAKELEEERKMIEELRYKGFRKIIHNLGKKNK